MKKLFSYFLLLTFFASCSTSNEQKPQIYSGNALGTTFQMQFFHANELQLGKKIDSTFTVLNASLSTYIQDSDISKINRGDSSVIVDQQFIDNFKASKEIHRITDGYFDPTVGLLVNAYGFGPEKYELVMNEKTIDSLMQFVGLDQVSLSEDNRIIKKHPETFLDFNSIAKGYAVDRLAALLDKNGIENYLIEVGGELVAKGTNLSKNDYWKIGIDQPLAGDNKNRSLLEDIVNLKDKAMATSGNYRKFKIDSLGNKFVHTINPKTGKSEASDVLSASVFASNCMTADAYATAFMAMGINKSTKLLSNIEGIEAVLIFSEGNEIKTFISEGIKSDIEK